MRRSSTKSKDIPQAPAIRPAWIEKTSPRGNRYRVCTVSLMLLPTLLETEKLEPKIYFRYAPEGGEVLGVRRSGDEKTREL